jgi:hypothetical protein
MERGTERERAAVRARWAALERRERRARRLLVGTALLATAPVLLLLVAAMPTEACVAAAGARTCRIVAPGAPGLVALVVVTAAATAVGGWLCGSALEGRE